ncbi:MAG TPA: hypothetical protein VGH34_01800 [Vicinamibacterales bacterium]|jgi:hypothetical protein
MRRSQQVSLQLVPIAAALFLTACETTQKTCVDQNQQVVADTNCTGQAWDDSMPVSERRAGSPYYWHWMPGRFFGRSFASSYFSGTGSRSGTSGRSATTRGGFGSSAASHGGSSS